jgi:FkbM family methyltransferase
MRSFVGRTLHAIVARMPTRVLDAVGRLEQRSRAARAVARTVMRPMREADVTIAHGPAAGMRISCGGAFPSRALGTAEPEVQEAIAGRLKTGDVFFDLGANVGFYTLLGARAVGQSGTVVAVEPQPKAVERLRHNLALNSLTNVSVVAAAVAEVSGDGELALSLDGVLEWAGLLDGDWPAEKRVTVSITTIDELSEGVAPPTLIKLDVEGAEVRALAGAERTLRASRPVIVCEAHGTGSDVAAVLEQAGYEVSSLSESSEIVEYGQLLALPRAG